MIESQFDEQMTRLVKEFGKYSAAKLKIFWDHYRSMPYYLFSEVVTELIGSYEKKPLKPQFDKAIIAAKSRVAYADQHDRENIDSLPDCTMCNKTGTVFALKRGDTLVRSFLCSCDAPKALGFPTHFDGKKRRVWDKFDNDYIPRYDVDEWIKYKEFLLEEYHKDLRKARE